MLFAASQPARLAGLRPRVGQILQDYFENERSKIDLVSTNTPHSAHFSVFRIYFVELFYFLNFSLIITISGRFPILTGGPHPPKPGDT